MKMNIIEFDGQLTFYVKLEMKEKNFVKTFGFVLLLCCIVSKNFMFLFHSMIASVIQIPGGTIKVHTSWFKQ